MSYEIPSDFVKVGNIEYKIDTDFRIWGKFGSDIYKINDDSEKCKFIVNFAISLGLPVSMDSISAVLEFYGAGKNPNSQDKIKVNKKTPRAFDFIKDDNLITAAFRSQYGINLRTESLHWWEFLSLFNGLSDEQTICRIMSIRTIDISKLGKEQKAIYRKLQQEYALDKKPAQTLEQRNNAMRDKIKQLQKEVNGIG